MADIMVNGIKVEYQLLGDPSGQPVVITPGGRFAKEYIGVPQLGQALADLGMHALLWDRPGCGGSDISYEGRSESHMHAETLIGLVRELGLGRVVVAGGSAGSRVSILAAGMAPDVVSHLCVWWISGGPIALAMLAGHYYGDQALAALRGGMEAVAALPSWAEQIARNPRNRDIILSQDPDAFVEKMQDWAKLFAWSETSPVPGMEPGDFSRLTMPVRIYRSGRRDLHHTRRTSEWLHEMIPHSEFVDPPWPEDEWNAVSDVMFEPGRGLFESWPMLAGDIAEFARS